MMNPSKTEFMSMHEMIKKWLDLSGERCQILADLEDQDPTRQTIQQCWRLLEVERTLYCFNQQSLRVLSKEGDLIDDAINFQALSEEYIRLTRQADLARSNCDNLRAMSKPVPARLHLEEKRSQQCVIQFCEQFVEYIR
jgi:hypothetical protein